MAIWDIEKFLKQPENVDFAAIIINQGIPKAKTDFSGIWQYGTKSSEQ